MPREGWLWLRGWTSIVWGRMNGDVKNIRNMERHIFFGKKTPGLIMRANLPLAFVA